MQHDWFEDDTYTQSEDSNHFKKELCTQCLVEKYWWMRFKNKELKVQSYVFENATQYNPHSHKCSGELVKTTLF